MKLIKIRSTIVLTAVMCLSSFAQTESDLNRYVAIAKAVQQLDLLNDLLHVQCQSLDSMDYVLPRPLFTSDQGEFDLAMWPSSSKKVDYLGMDGPSLVTMFSNSFYLDSELHEPLIFSALEFSELKGDEVDFIMLVNGVVEFTGLFKGEARPGNYPFAAEFHYSKEEEGISCRLGSLSIGNTSSGTIDSADDPWSLHNKDFRNPFTSPLISSGLCSYGEFNSIIRTIDRLRESEDWLRLVKDGYDWSVSKASKRNREASIAHSELFHSLPHFVPRDQRLTFNRHQYNGDKEIASLLNDLIEREPGLEKKANSTANEYGQSDPIRIQALLTRAWSYVISDDLNSGFFARDIKKSSFYDQDRFDDLISFFGHAAKGEYDVAQQAIDRFNDLNCSSVLRHYLEQHYGKDWYAYGQRMDAIHEHDESMLGFFIGAQFSDERERLNKLAEKASKLGEDEVAKATLSRILEISDSEKEGDVWLHLAVAKAEQGLDPEPELTKALEINGEEQPLSHCARARYFDSEGNRKEAESQVYTGLKKWPKNPDLLLVRADMSTSLSSRKKHLKTAVKIQGDTLPARLFKKGFLHQYLAETDTTVMESKKRDNLYKEAIFFYKQSVRRGFSEGLGYKKIAECYIALDDMEEASYYFGKAIENQERDPSVYFIQSILNFSATDMEGFEMNLNKAGSMELEKVISERERNLYKFLCTVRDINQLIEVSTDDESPESTVAQQKEVLNKKVDDGIKELEVMGSERAAAYAQFCEVMHESIKGYNERELDDRKKNYRYKALPTGSVQEMLDHSDLEVQFFKKNEMMDPLRKWNEAFDKRIFKEIPHPKFRSSVEYLKESKFFSDSYNYL